jgi:hypothetical protein
MTFSERYPELLLSFEKWVYIGLARMLSAGFRLRGHQGKKHFVRYQVKKLW